MGGIEGRIVKGLESGEREGGFHNGGGLTFLTRLRVPLFSSSWGEPLVVCVCLSYSKEWEAELSPA